MIWDVSVETLAALVGVERITRVVAASSDRPFSGYTGEKAVIQVETPDGITRFVFLKRTRPEWARTEVTAYRILTAIGAPVVTCYGMYRLDADHALVAVEYLPITSAWPIPPALHLAWAEAVARLAQCPLPTTPGLVEVFYCPQHDAILAGIEAAVTDPDPDVRAALTSIDTCRVRDHVQSQLRAFLTAVDALPQAVTHGDGYSMHIGRRTPEGPVLFFDVMSAAIRPRFYDVQGLIVDHGEPYEIGDITPVLRRFHARYDPALPWERLRHEVALMEGLIALRTIGLHHDLLRQRRGEPWQDVHEAHRGHIKWIRLSMLKAQQMLQEWERQQPEFEG